MQSLRETGVCEFCGEWKEDGAVQSGLQSSASNLYTFLLLRPVGHVEQCFSTAGPLPGAGHWHHLYRAARGFPGICYFSFLNNFHE